MFKVATWNTETSRNNFLSLHAQKETSDQTEAQTKWDELSQTISVEDWDQLGENAIASLVDQGVQIFTLQEAMFFQDARDAGRKNWFNDQFNWIGRWSGETIAWDSSRFTPLVGSLKTGEMFVSIDLFDRTTHKIIRVTSMHVIGYSLEAMRDENHPNHGDTQWSVTKDTQPKLETALNTVGDAEVYDAHIIGSDTNSDPRAYTGIHKVFVEKGLSYDESTRKTNYNPLSTDEDLIERQLDYLFSKEATSKNIPVENIGLANKENNPSDHVPVIEEYTVVSNIIKTLRSLSDCKELTEEEISQKNLVFDLKEKLVYSSTKTLPDLIEKAEAARRKKVAAIFLGAVLLAATVGYAIWKWRRGKVPTPLKITKPAHQPISGAQTQRS